jgi:ATP-dependent DNA ligase
MQVTDPDAARRTGVPVFLYLFDLLHLDGHDVTALELRHGKALLRRLLDHRDCGSPSTAWARAWRSGKRPAAVAGKA